MIDHILIKIEPHAFDIREWRECNFVGCANNYVEFSFHYQLIGFIVNCESHTYLYFFFVTDSNTHISDTVSQFNQVAGANYIFSRCVPREYNTPKKKQQQLHQLFCILLSNKTETKMDDEAGVPIHADFFSIYGDFLWVILGAFLFIFFLVSIRT